MFLLIEAENAHNAPDSRSRCKKHGISPQEKNPTSISSERSDVGVSPNVDAKDFKSDGNAQIRIAVRATHLGRKPHLLPVFGGKVRHLLHVRWH